ncbi:MAG: hypothetical protein AB8I08_06930 [Sandaracinaceae bacterium]
MDVDSFVERGVLAVPGCFDPDWAKRRVRETLIAGAPPPLLSCKGRPVDFPPAYDLASTWEPVHRLDVETGLSFEIEALAPKLWEVICALVGPGAHITRRKMGTQWIVAPNTTAPERPSLEADFERDFATVDNALVGTSWHIDTPARDSTLDARHDALTLLVLWSDFPEGGGGTLYSGESLTHVVRHLEARAEGCDTRDVGWANGLMTRCGDVRELSGRAGDVLVTHGLALHSTQTVARSAFRVLENPTITVERPLRYHTDTPDPSPVERAVIQRLTKPRPRPEQWDHTTARALITLHPTLFLPGRRAWLSENDAGERERITQTCEALLAAWVGTHSSRIRMAQRSAPLQCAKGAAALVRQLLLDHLSLRLPLPPQRGESSGFLYCDLVRGFVHADVPGQLVALLLAPIVEGVELAVLDDRTLPLIEHDGVRIVVDPRASATLFAFGAARPGLPALKPRVAQAIQQAPRQTVQPLRGVRHGLPEVRREAPRDEDIWSAFLRVRMHHVLATRAKPGAYASLLETHRASGITQRVIEAFARRDGHS